MGEFDKANNISLICSLKKASLKSDISETHTKWDMCRWELSLSASQFLQQATWDPPGRSNHEWSWYWTFHWLLFEYLLLTSMCHQKGGRGAKALTLDTSVPERLRDFNLCCLFWNPVLVLAPTTEMICICKQALIIFLVWLSTWVVSSNRIVRVKTDNQPTQRK